LSRRRQAKRWPHAEVSCDLIAGRGIATVALFAPAPLSLNQTTPHWYSTGSVSDLSLSPEARSGSFRSLTLPVLYRRVCPHVMCFDLVR
jgi:hypothetical protein